MDVEQLRRLVVACEVGNLRAAAKLLHISQPALSSSIASLEAQLGATMLERSSKGVRATEFAQAILPRARHIINEERRIRTDLGHLRGLQENSISIGISAFSAVSLMPEILPSLLRQVSGIAITVVTARSDDLVSMVANGTVDVAFCAPVGRHAETLHSLEYQEATKDRFLVHARPTNPIFALSNCNMNDLAGCLWATIDSPYGQDVIKDAFLGCNIDPPRSILRTTSTELLRALIIRTDTIGLLPSSYSREFLDAGLLRVFEEPSLTFDVAQGVLFRSERRNDPAVERVVSAIIFAYT